MPKTVTLAIRLDPTEHAALLRASKLDDRAPSTLARKVLVEWLRKGEPSKEGRPDD